jgi:hypothetical protein
LESKRTIDDHGSNTNGNSNSASARDSTLDGPNRHSPSLPPPQCTESQLAAILKTLPNGKSIQRKTNCPDATWIEDHTPNNNNGASASAKDLPILRAQPQSTHSSLHRLWLQQGPGCRQYLAHALVESQD